MKPRLPRPIVAFTLPIVCSLVIAPGAAHAAWSGWARCVVESTGTGYNNTETHTWIVNGASTMALGTGTWSVAGQGHLDTGNPAVQSEHAEWSVSGHEASGTTGSPPMPSGPRFAVVSSIGTGMLSIEARHTASTQTDGISGYVQQTRGGNPDPPVRVMSTASEWGFPNVKGPSTSTTLNGSSQRPLTQAWGFRQIGNNVSETCSWMFADGSILPLPPPVYASPAPGQTRVDTVVSPTAPHPTATIQLGNSDDLVGGGAQTNWTGNGNLLTATHPGPLGQNLWAAAGKDHWYPDPTTITAYAIALADPADHWEVTLVAQTSLSSSALVARATLPTGYVLTGGGCLLNWPQGASGYLLTASFPASTTEWECRGKDHAIVPPRRAVLSRPWTGAPARHR